MLSCRSTSHSEIFNTEITWGFTESLKSLKKLEKLIIRDSRLSGSIPDFINELHSLTEINLSNNNLSGVIPKQITLLPSLRTLDLHGNNLNQYIPVEIGRLTNLEHLDLHNNRIYSPIPMTMRSLENLVTVDLSNNILVAYVPDIFSSLRRLRVFNVAGNRLSGPLPVSLLAAESLQYIDISDNVDLGSLHAASPNSSMESFFETNKPFGANAAKTSLGDLPPLPSLLGIDIANTRFRIKDLSFLAGRTLYKLGFSLDGDMIPRWISFPPTLISLRLSDSGLTELPQWITRLQDLAELWVVAILNQTPASASSS
ncbi:hypothetical protein HK105_201417 [Polyrhizophydium stewartii]|uniref:Uncharacterized protein n=1 Tax=Polyrhizophydium stewartii TaxID=2732419 RepID=A0ABR4NI59_9FUNG